MQTIRKTAILSHLAMPRPPRGASLLGTEAQQGSRRHHPKTHPFPLGTDEKEARSSNDWAHVYAVRHQPSGKYGGKKKGIRKIFLSLSP